MGFCKAAIAVAIGRVRWHSGANISQEMFLEAEIRNNCPHCDRTSQAFVDFLEESENFYVVCDAHPLVEGHLLIIPKDHISCVGAFSDAQMAEFLPLYNRAVGFVRERHGSAATFEHGKIGQTVFHAHVHILPFDGTPEQIVPEGAEHLRRIDSIEALHTLFAHDDKYLFFSIGDDMWSVDTSLGVPRFFRDRFAHAFGAPERGNWKAMHVDAELMKKAATENNHCKELWDATKADQP